MTHCMHHIRGNPKFIKQKFKKAWGSRFSYRVDKKGTIVQKIINLLFSKANIGRGAPFKGNLGGWKLSSNRGETEMVKGEVQYLIRAMPKPNRLNNAHKITEWGI